MTQVPFPPTLFSPRRAIFPGVFLALHSRSFVPLFHLTAADLFDGKPSIERRICFKFVNRQVCSYIAWTYAPDNTDFPMPGARLKSPIEPLLITYYEQD